MPYMISLTPQKRPAGQDSEEMLDWICQSLGLESGRDTQHVASRVFRITVLRLHDGEPVTSEILASEAGVSVQVVNHHLRGFIDSGMFVREKRHIRLRGYTLYQTLEDMQAEANQLFVRLATAAKDME